MFPNLSGLSHNTVCVPCVSRVPVGAPLSDLIKKALAKTECNLCFELLSSPSPNWKGADGDPKASEWAIVCSNQHIFHRACIKTAWDAAGIGKERCPDCRLAPSEGTLVDSVGWTGAPVPNQQPADPNNPFALGRLPQPQTWAGRRRELLPEPEAPPLPQRQSGFQNESSADLYRARFFGTDGFIMRADSFDAFWGIERIGTDIIEGVDVVDTDIIEGVAPPAAAQYELYSTVNSIVHDLEVSYMRHAEYLLTPEMTNARVAELKEFQGTLLAERVNSDVLERMLSTLYQYMALSPPAEYPYHLERYRQIYSFYKDFAYRHGLVFIEAYLKFEIGSNFQLLND